MASAAKHFLLCSKSLCSQMDNMKLFAVAGFSSSQDTMKCVVRRRHKKPLHISSGDPWGEINVSARNTPDHEQAAQNLNFSVQ